MEKLKLAILDMYDGTPNQGMRCIKEILDNYSEQVEYRIFDVRQKTEVPSLDFDIYIGTGGPGDPREGNGVWDKAFYSWMSDVEKYNADPEVETKKYIFFICHSFQMACAHFEIGEISKRKSMSFGTFPVYMTEDGQGDAYFQDLDSPFYIADFRNFQVTNVTEEQLERLGSTVLALEKPRPMIPLERAVMAVRFTNEMFGTQFHPEADGDGMLTWLQTDEKKEQVIKDHSFEKYETMIADLSDPNKIEKTQHAILPAFMEHCIEQLMGVAI
jgi:homoserine O-succinyltransferase/O-acetyltransferase